MICLQKRKSLQTFASIVNPEDFSKLTAVHTFWRQNSFVELFEWDSSANATNVNVIHFPLNTAHRGKTLVPVCKVFERVWNSFETVRVIEFEIWSSAVTFFSVAICTIIRSDFSKAEVIANNWIILLLMSSPQKGKS